MRPEAQRLVDELDSGAKHLIGDRVVSCLACSDGGAVVSVGIDPKPGTYSLDTAITTTVVPCPNCPAGQARARAEAAIETYDCSHDWQADHAAMDRAVADLDVEYPSPGGLFICTKCGLHARLGLQRVPDR